MSLEKIQTEEDIVFDVKPSFIDLSNFKPKKSYLTLAEFIQQDTIKHNERIQQAINIYNLFIRFSPPEERKAKIRLLIKDNKVSYVSENFIIKNSFYKSYINEKTGGNYKEDFNNDTYMLHCMTTDVRIEYINKTNFSVKYENGKLIYYFDKDFKLIGYEYDGNGEFMNYELSNGTLIFGDIRILFVDIFITQSYRMKMFSFKEKNFSYHLIDSEEDYDYENNMTNYIYNYEINPKDKYVSKYDYPSKFSITNPQYPQHLDVFRELGNIMKKEYFYYLDGSIMYDGDNFCSKTRGKVPIVHEVFNKIKSKDEMMILKLIDMMSGVQIETQTIHGSSKRR
jgi:hypothetical protein